MNDESKGIPSAFADDYSQNWMEEHLGELKQYVSGQRILYGSLAIGFATGLVAHIGGYYLISSFPGGFLGLMADLLHALGWSLWTGAVVTVFVQVIPEVKQRQIRQAIEAYEALRSQKTESS